MAHMGGVPNPRDDFMTSIRKLGAQPAPSPSSMRDEYAEWVGSTDPGDCLVDNPIQYWLLRRRQYPRLSRMAIDLFSIPAMSSEPERIFSLAGQMAAAQRGRLKADLIKADLIGAAQCILSWEKKWGYPDIQMRSKSIQIKSNQIRSMILLSKSNQIGPRI
ncbi:transposase [Hirsutella rhossiliensis]